MAPREDETVEDFIKRAMNEREISVDAKEFGEVLWTALAVVIVSGDYEMTEGDVHLVSLADIFNRYYAIRRRYHEEYELSLKDDGLRDAYPADDLPSIADSHAKLVITNNIMTFYTVCYELADSLMEAILPDEILHPDYVDVPATRDIFESQGYDEKRQLLRAIKVTEKDTHLALGRIGTLRGDLVHDMAKRMTAGDMTDVDKELLQALKAVNRLFELLYGGQAFRIED